MDVGRFFRDRKLRKINRDVNKSKSSVLIAESKLSESKSLFEAGFYNQVILSAYTSMFHSARALLYRDGVQEKSHYAVYVYLREKYSGKLPLDLIGSFLNYQSKRKELLYGLEGFSSNKDDAEESIEDAERFLAKVKEVLRDGKL